MKIVFPFLSLVILLAGCGGFGQRPEPTGTPIPRGYPGSPVTTNADWEPVIEEFDGVEMALVPAGCFMMGSTEAEIDYAMELCESARGESECERGYLEDQAPRHEVCFDEPFWMDVYEVTNAQYGSPGIWSGESYPRENVDWFGAADHCEGRGARLPTEAEWEYAARGPDGLIFPWGNSFDGALLNYCDANCTYNPPDLAVDDGYRHTAPVGSYPGGVSWVGAHDMSGNVWEWTDSVYEPYPYEAGDGSEEEGSSDSSSERVVLRGGSWIYFSYDACATYRGRDTPSTSYIDIGFRCVRSLNGSGFEPVEP
jgi:formylglycine-generating enzyme required for sulfatase activity